MSKYKVLIVMPRVRPGGVGSSLASFYPLIDKNRFDIAVFPLIYSTYKEKQVLSYFESVLPCNETVSAFYCVLRDVKGLRKAYSCLIKVIGKLFNRNKFEKFIIQKAIQKIEQNYKYDTVVAFIEGPTTKFVSYFHCPNKIAWVHCNYNYYLPLNCSEENIYNQFNHIVTVSHHTTEVFKQRYPSLALRTTTIYNPIDINRVTHLSSEAIDDDRFQKAPFTIISVGRISKIKRFPSIPQIARDLKEKGVKFKWYIIGLPLDKMELELIKRLIVEYNLQDYVFYLGNKLNPYPYFKNANLLVSTSKSEACPMIFNEAKILNVPIVSSDFPSAFEFIDSGVNGIITSIDTMADAIFSIVNNLDLYQTLKSNSVYSDKENATAIMSFESVIESSILKK